MKARDNPFSMDRVERVRFRPQGLSWEDLMQRLADLGHRAAIVGPDGSGKTTLLEDLGPRLEASGFRIRRAFLNEEAPVLTRAQRRELLADLTPRDVLLVDGADHMPWLHWRLLKYQSGRAGGLVIACHRAGLLPALLETSTSLMLLEAIVREVLGKQAEDVEPMLPSLFERRRGNVREVLRDLYDAFGRR